MWSAGIINPVALDNGWDSSAEAWIEQVEKDLNRSLVLDAPMLEQCGDVSGKRVLDVGCGEGRFCRMLGERGADTVGVDPTERFIQRCIELDSVGEYLTASGEDLPFADATFDLVVSYLVLIDIPDFRAAIQEMARVLKPGGRLVMSNLQSFATTRDRPWIRNEAGEKLYFAMDNYNEERGERVEWAGISIVNFHRPMHMYMNAFIDAGLVLKRYLEPLPSEESVKVAPSYADYLRVPYMVLMTWEKPIG